MEYDAIMDGETHRLLPEFTALENVMIPALIAGTDKSNAARKAKELIELMGLSNLTLHQSNHRSHLLLSTQ